MDLQASNQTALRDDMRLLLDRLPTVRSNIEATDQWVSQVKELLARLEKYRTIGDFSIEDDVSDIRQVRIELLAMLRTAWEVVDVWCGQMVAYERAQRSIDLSPMSGRLQACLDSTMGIRCSLTKIENEAGGHVHLLQSPEYRDALAKLRSHCKPRR